MSPRRLALSALAPLLALWPTGPLAAQEPYRDPPAPIAQILDAPLTPAADWKIAGTSVPKVNGRAIVTGAHRYASDVSLPDMQFGRVLRGERPGATLVSLDSSRAEAMEGVTVVRDGDFVGVAAPSAQLAARVLSRLRAEWKLPPASNEDLFVTLKRAQSSGGGGGSWPGRRRGS